MMARLIDANSILDDFLKRYTEMEKDGKLVFAACEIKQDFADMISNATTVDAVKVVRCKDCCHSYDDIGGLTCSYGPCVDCIVPEDFYCKHGERKERMTSESNQERQSSEISLNITAKAT